ncbi:PREDICTED: suppressor of fused homolog [Ceratosolen solmsi marchali]|uniref:Suppressor of fused homolog n=1 Tax=Ceratosolen solmsi marchali TaxID=326594 RepID=A0AAJ6YGG5_9HYME|nr:PREDICTED: suppressor of fused homolog [Ceratosolen solmsi marchali]
MYGSMRERVEHSPNIRALGLDALHALCRDVYPEQGNPLTVTAILKYWLGGPDPLDYISMYENPGCPELGVPPHWHYISLGLSDLHGDGRLHPRSGPGRPSGFGFELTFRLVRERGETSPPTWPANVMQQLAKYVFNSGNMLMPGDHVSWHAPLDGGPGPGRITQILMGRDPQLPASAATPHGEVSFVQIVGVTSEELQAAQHWNGLGVINLLKTTRGCGSWLVTDMRRINSVMEEDPSIAEKIQGGIEREGSNLSGVSAKCWWVQMCGEKSTEKYRERRDDSDEEELDIKPTIKSERLSPCDQDANIPEDNGIKPLLGLHLTFNLEAGSLLPLAIKGRVMHGRHFTFKSILSHTAVTIVAPSVTGTLVSRERPYVVQGPWLQVLLPEDLAETMAQEFQILSTPEHLQLPRTFSWPEHKLAITIAND